MPRDIETYHHSVINSHNFCCSQNVVGTTFMKGLTCVWTFPIMCGRWECKRCAKIKAKRLRRKTYRSWKDTDVRHIVLTCNTNQWSIKESCKEINHAWDLLLKRLRRRWPQMKVFKALEFTQAGFPHLHVLVDSFIPQKYLSNVWNELFRSTYVWINFKKTGPAVAYVTKYASKWSEIDSGYHCLYYLFKLRRYSYTRNFFTAAPQKERTTHYFGSDANEASSVFNAVAGELAETYRVKGASPEGDVLFFDSNSDPPLHPLPNTT